MIVRNWHLAEMNQKPMPNKLKILDTYRIFSDNIIPTYPIEYFLIVSHERYLK